MENEYSDEYLAISITNELQNLLLNLLKKQFPKTKVYVVITAQADIKCQVWPFSIENHIYVLAMSIGTFSSIGAWLRDEIIWQKLISKSTYMCKINSADFYRLAAQMTISALAYHEIVHIIKGHNGYINAGIRISDHERDSRKKICEVDADQWCSYLLGGDLLQSAKQLSHALFNTEKIHQSITIELLEVLSVGLYRTLAIFNHPDITPSSLYPHPLLRATRIAVGTADNIETSESVSYSTTKRLISVLNGLAYAEKYIKSENGITQKDWYIGQELMDFEHKYEGLLNQLQKELVPFIPN
ncbi:MAG: hypothetical protein KZQ99_08545 [Candidatus Thiodiazotropha sp. (ex Dulcina madagascariensis)]|nr:hypothetical protein [Candidatus Thiodiazotropha sp. (ex Dulcina madagascariensis)]